MFDNAVCEMAAILSRSQDVLIAFVPEDMGKIIYKAQHGISRVHYSEKYRFMHCNFVIVMKCLTLAEPRFVTHVIKAELTQWKSLSASDGV